MSNDMKFNFSFSGKLLNQINNSWVFFHCVSPDFFLTIFTIFSRSFLLTLPSSGFVGLISLEVGLFLKLGLWSFNVWNASCFAVAKTLSSMSSFVTITFASSVILATSSVSAFLYSLCSSYSSRASASAGFIL